MNKKLFLVLFLVLGLAGCNLPGTGSNAGTNAQDLVATRVEATQQALQASAQPGDSQPDEEPQSTEPDGLLPHTLYYLSSADGEIFQVWMLDRDGLSNTRVTSEPNGVDEYSVSPADGRVAFITNNQIYIINPSGDQRQLLVDGSSSIAESDEYFYTQRINGLSWSPDGGSLAYGRNGLHIYHFETQTDEHILPNEIEERDSGFLFPQALYSPYQWSPDGSQLLVNISYYEAGTLGIYTPGSPEIEKLGDKIICCQPTWSPDSRSIVVASPFLGYIDSGLWLIQVCGGSILLPEKQPN
ncbi:MAG: DPP IV N-terminal domain-containing protein [Anaerolineales bacterium]